jgi:hypothetical protein
LKSSISQARWALVRALMPRAGRPRSTTVTCRPREASSYAVDSPAIPAPITSTSVVSGPDRLGTSIAGNSIQGDRLSSSSTFMRLSMRLGAVRNTQTPSLDHDRRAAVSGAVRCA